jgi:hypothetical protein
LAKKALALVLKKKAWTCASATRRLQSLRKVSVDLRAPLEKSCKAIATSKFSQK